MDETIFRAYDIRGVYPSQVNEDMAYNLGRAFGTWIGNDGQEFTTIGYDNRDSSENLFAALSKGIMDSGIDVINLGLVTTPMYYFSWHFFKSKSGIMITASHNPKEYNGFKFSFNGQYNSHGQEIQDFKELIKSKNFNSGKGTCKKVDIKEHYMDFLLKDVEIGNLDVVFDVGNGSGSIVIEDILKRLPIKYTPLFFESDPSFPNHHPDPSVPENLKDLSDKVLETGADVGFALDGDADRIGMVDELGNIIEPDKLMIIVIRDILEKIKDKRILFDVKCSKALEDEINKLGGIPVLSRTGNSYLRSAISKENILFGGEFSGHIFFNDKFLGYDDGIYASLRLMEIISRKKVPVSSLLKGINKYYSTEELKFKTEDSIKFSVIEKIKEVAEKEGLDVITLDGCKIIYEDGFALIRASNTGPNLTARFEAVSNEKLEEIRRKWSENIEKLIN